MRGNGVISTAGAGPNETPSEAQLQYLDTVCSTTQASIDYAMREMPPRPTMNPTRRVSVDAFVVFSDESFSFSPKKSHFLSSWV